MKPWFFVRLLKSSTYAMNKNIQLTLWGIGLYLPNSQKSLIILARQNKLLEMIKSMTIIESEMISHQQLFLSSQEP